MYVIIGLGNPGSEYDGTRHNLGFAVIDAIAEKENVGLRAGKGEYFIGWLNKAMKEVALVKPLTYMNNSGVAVKELMESFNITLEELLVVSDDINLPLGTIRIRSKGSDGGHNGLYSIIYQLQTNMFARIRCGIAGKTIIRDTQTMTDFVLSRFEKEESIIVKKMIQDARDAAIEIIKNGIPKAMNLFNKRI